MQDQLFVNFSNHPSQDWTSQQMTAALAYGRTVVDLPFPSVPAQWGYDEVQALAAACVEQIAKLAPAAVLCQGEFTLAFQVVEGLKARGIVVMAACSERDGRPSADSAWFWRTETA